MQQGLKPGDRVIVEGIAEGAAGRAGESAALQTQARKVSHGRFFIDRPVFAIVIAIVIVLLGAVAIPALPIATYPEVVPPVVQITANYLGGNSQDLEKTVAQPIEQQLVGLDGMLYFLSRSSNNGALTIDVTFELGTNIDLATVKTQNKVSVALPQLPPEVQRAGRHRQEGFVGVPDGRSRLVVERQRYDALFLNNYATDQSGGQDRQLARRGRFAACVAARVTACACG